MEAIPRLPMLSFPGRTTTDNVSLGDHLKKYIRNYYHEDPESYNAEIHELEGLRRSAINASSDFIGCSTLKKYYCQLQFLTSRFLFEEGGIKVQFYWVCAFDHNLRNSGDIDEEKDSVLYNIATLHTSLGALDERTTSDGMKISCTHFQCAAWAFQTLAQNSKGDSELNPLLMNFMMNLSLSQAQECILEKSMTDHRKPNIIAKVAMQVVEYLRQTMKNLESFKKSNSVAVDLVGSKLFKNWQRHCEFKICYYYAVTYFHQGLQSEEQQKMGERLAYLQAAVEKLDESSKIAKNLDKAKSLGETLTFANDVIRGKQTACLKENEFVYHEKIPALSSLPEVKGASLVKGISFSFTDAEVAGPDIFARLVPMEAHQASSMYSEEKAKLLRKMGQIVQEKNDELDSYLASMQLDTLAIEDNLDTLPQELVDCCADLNSRSALKELADIMANISSYYHDIKKKIQLVQAVIQEEEEKEKEFATIMGRKTPPNPSLSDYNKELLKYKEAHETAQNNNQTLHTAINQHKDNISALSQPINNIIEIIPSVAAVESEGDRQTRMEVQRLLNKVGEMQNQRRELDAQLRNNIHQDDITKQLVTNKEDVEEFFEKQLKKHDSVIGLLEQNMKAQGNILQALSEANATFASARRQINKVKIERHEIISSFIGSYNAFMNIIDKAEDAKNFYAKLESQIGKLESKVKAHCKVQDEKREGKLTANVKKFDRSHSISATEGVKLKDYKNSSSDGPKLKDYLIDRGRLKSTEASDFSYHRGSMNYPPVEHGYSSYIPSAPTSYKKYSNPEQSTLPPEVATYSPQHSSVNSSTYIPSSPSAISSHQAPTVVSSSGTTIYDNRMQYPSPYYASGTGSDVNKGTNSTMSTSKNDASTPAGYEYPLEVYFPNKATGCEQSYYHPRHFNSSYVDPKLQMDVGMQYPTQPTNQNYPSSAVNYAQPAQPNTSNTPVSNYPAATTNCSVAPVNYSTQPLNYAPQSANTNYPMQMGNATYPGLVNYTNYSSQAGNKRQAVAVTNGNGQRAYSTTTENQYDPVQTYKGYNTGVVQPGCNVSYSPNYQGCPISSSSPYLQTNNQVSTTYPQQYGASNMNYVLTTNNTTSTSQTNSQYTSSDSTAVNQYYNQTNVATTIYNQTNVATTIYNQTNVATTIYNQIASSYQYPQTTSNNSQAQQYSNQAIHGAYQNMGSYGQVPPQGYNTNVQLTQNLPETTACSVPNKPSSGVVSNVDLLSDLDLSINSTNVQWSPLKPDALDSTSLSEVPLNSFSAQPIVNVSQASVESINSGNARDQEINESEINNQGISSASSILNITKFAKQTNRSISFVDPLSNDETLNSLVTETEKFSKFVQSLDKKPLNGPTNLELKWKELQEITESKSCALTVSVGRCYPLSNRFSDILPFDVNRVQLPSSRDDYINASYVQLKDVGESIPMILTQAPLPNTTNDFWTMVWENNVEIIVCLNTDAEAKGQMYYPKDLNGCMEIGTLTITVKQVQTSSNGSKIQSTFHVEQNKSKTSKVVIHLQYIAWPPGSMPDSPGTFLQFLIDVQNLQKQQRNKLNPMVVHCVSGTGRSGVFAVLSSFVKQFNNTGTLADICNLLLDLNNQRRAGIQDRNHMLFLYSAALYHIQEALMKRGILTGKSFEEGRRKKSHVRHPSADLLSSDLSRIKAKLGLDNESSGDPNLYQSDSQSSIVSGHSVDSSGNQAACLSAASELSQALSVTPESTATPSPTHSLLNAENHKSPVKLGGSALPPNLAASLDPDQLVLQENVAPKTKKITRESFSGPSHGLGSIAKSEKDPFGDIDPLWNLKK